MFDDAPHPISEMEEEISHLKFCSQIKDSLISEKEAEIAKLSGDIAFLQEFYEKELKAKDAKIAELEGRIKALEGSRQEPDLGFI